MMNIEQIKDEIQRRFETNLKGKKFNSNGYDAQHDGKEGHWVEAMLGVEHNADNKPDLLGFEIKKQTNLKITFGDWSPSSNIWKGEGRGRNAIPPIINKSEFLHIFGKPNAQKNNRYSWSGEPVPSYLNRYTTFGQIMLLEDNGDIVIYYSFENDRRENKHNIVPAALQQENLELCRWKKEKLQECLTRKFGQNGWVKCYKDRNGFYTHIGFAPTITYEQWIEKVQEGIVFFDSGMYEGNNRQYSQWRANNQYWESLITETR